MDGDGLALQTGVVDAAQLPDTDHTVGINAAHHHAQCVQMGAHQYGAAAVLTLQRNIRRVFVVIGDGVSKFLCKLLYHGVHLHIIPHRAGNIDDFFKIGNGITRHKAVFHNGALLYNINREDSLLKILS